MKVEVRDRSGPIGIDFRHVHPRRERSSKRVQETLLRIIDLGDTKNVVDIGDNGETLWWN